MKNLINWLQLKDYTDAMSAILQGAVARFSRGNIKMQQSRFLTSGDAKLIAAEGDKAAKFLRKSVKTC